MKKLLDYLPAKLRDSSRALSLAIAAALTLLLTAAFYPGDFSDALGLQLGLTVSAVSRVALGAYLGYWADRIAFHYARPDQLTGIEAGTAWKRRAVIIAAAIVGMAIAK